MFRLMEKSDYSNLSVVIIDDDAMVSRSLEKALTDLGFVIKAFSDPLAALEWIDKKGADIVISDICMPKCDGFSVLEHVKKSQPQCEVIFITAHGQIDLAIRALREGAADFFEKPISAATLQAAIERSWRYRLLSQQQKLLSDKIDLMKERLASKERFDNVMIGESAIIRKVIRDIVDLANSNANVLIIGESGTGKELAARAIHSSSPRCSEPFITINCPSIPVELFESEIFGHRKGSFTGAIETRLGYIEAAEGGTLFLDEIGDLPAKVQPKILRLLEQKTYTPVGEHNEKPANIRIIAATNQPLEDLVKSKTFREDLYYRLKVCFLEIPPLRKRKDDIPLLSLFFTLHFASEMNKNIDGIEDDTLQFIMEYDYPGNVRELRNIIESSVIHCKHTGWLKRQDIQGIPEQGTIPSSPIDTPKGASLKFTDVERQLYEETLNRTDNNVSAAARILGLSRGKLRRRMESLDIKAP